MLVPLDEGEFAVSAVRHNEAGFRGFSGRTMDQPLKVDPSTLRSLTPVERSIFEDCRSTLAALVTLLEQDGG